MQVNVEAPGGLKREMRVTIPADRVTQAVDDKLRKFSQRAKLPGFRPGKAPFKVIQQQYGMSARMEAVSELVESSFPDAVKQSGVRPAGRPQFNVTAEKSGEPLEYVASFEVMPEIVLQGLEALEIEQPVVDVTDEDVERLVTNLRKGRRTLATVERAAAKGDMVKLNFDGKLDGESFAGGKGEGVEIELGAGQFLPDLENGIAGHAAGQSFQVPVNFPEDYRAENLRGKTAQFDVTVIEVREITLPPVDDAEFLKAHGVDTVDALRSKARDALDNERQKAIQRRRKAQVLEQLAKLNPVEVIPAALIDQEIVRARAQAVQRMNMGNMPADKLEQMLPGQLFEPQARQKVALGLVLAEVIRQKDVKVDPARVSAALDQIARDYEQPDQVKMHYYSNPQLFDGLRSVVLEDQAVEMLLEGARNVDAPMSLEQLLNPQAQA